ncbi:alpha/beta fold hydrolase [Egicoccus sp. AB-alg2]|uniref:alpha/beta fold hydrolase n=1 Tax=Egicoccus sp. AB-alg2 TaxID=3242693 RepID=UPI00359DFE0E
MTVAPRPPAPDGGTSNPVAGASPLGLRAPATDDVRGAFLHLAERFQPEEARNLDAKWVIELVDHPAAATTFHVRSGRILVSPGAAATPVARLRTDAATWLDLVAGRQDGVAAFLGGRLEIAGDLNLAARFETMFAPGPEATRLLRTVETSVKGVRLESLVAGHGDPVLLLHGLGANKVSFLPLLDGLAHDHEVHALDLPGFGKSAKPLPTGRRYTMAWMADVVHGYLVRNRIRDVHVVGNSMGGRIAIELALRHPEAVRSVVGLGAAVAFDEYQRFGPLLRFTRPHWVGAAPVPVPRQWVEAGIRELFCDPARIPAANFRAAADDTMRYLGDPGYRLALLACARHLGAEKAGGRRSYWTRLATLRTPSYWVFGSKDRLVRQRYAARVADRLPAATVDVWEDVGHVPQFEVPERAITAVRDWIAGFGAPEHARPA